ncbi:HNH endonuclease [Arthrobacter sp. HLT1-21]
MSRRAGRKSSALTAQVLQTYGIRCWLKLPGCTRRATTKDHVVPYAHGGTDDVTNFRPACHSCNSQRQDRVISGVGATIKIVTGPPAAGKTTHVAEHAIAGDVIIDLDKIAAALMPSPPSPEHAYPDYVRHIAIGARKAAIDRATRLSRRITVWIIHAIPDPLEVALYKSLHYDVIEIDPGRPTVVERCRTMRPDYTMASVDRWYALKAGTTHTTTTAYDTTTAALEHAPSRDW